MLAGGALAAAVLFIFIFFTWQHSANQKRIVYCTRATTTEDFRRRPLQWVPPTRKRYTVRVFSGFFSGRPAKTIPQRVPPVGEGAGTARFGGFAQWVTPLKASRSASL